MRVFAAIRPPDAALEHVADAVESIMAPLRAVRGVRVSSSENWHLTTAFFGEVPDGAIDELSVALRSAAAQTAPFTLQLAGAGVFGGRVLWLGVGTGSDTMRALMRSTCEAAAEVGIESDRPDRSRAHLTIARSKTGTVLAAAAAALAVYRGPRWCADSLLLYRSELGQGRSGGSLYTVLDAFRLGAEGRPAGH